MSHPLNADAPAAERSHAGHAVAAPESAGQKDRAGQEIGSTAPRGQYVPPPHAPRSTATSSLRVVQLLRLNSRLTERASGILLMLTPSARSSHADAPGGEVRPFTPSVLHAVPADEPAGQNSPGSHPMGNVVPAGQYRPLGHAPDTASVQSRVTIAWKLLLGN